jgi:hypothetical protein
VNDHIACVIVVGMLAALGAVAYLLGDYFGRIRGWTDGFNTAQRLNKENSESLE